MKTIELDHPFSRGDVTISSVGVRQPAGTGWLKNVKLFDLMQFDVAALTTVLPRITDPALTEQEIRTKLHPADLFQIGSAVVNFLLPKSALTDELPPE
jgi:hypothetical protein